MNLSKLEAYPSKEALAEELRRLTIESEVKHHGCCQVIVQTFLDILGVQNEALSMAASPFVGNPPQKKYRSYLLRLWCEETLDRAWQASLEDPHTGQRIGFASLEQLFAFLMDPFEGDAKGGRME